MGAPEGPAEVSDKSKAKPHPSDRHVWASWAEHQPGLRLRSWASQAELSMPAAEGTPTPRREKGFLRKQSESGQARPAPPHCCQGSHALLGFGSPVGAGTQLIAIE